jgi:hypothetical protein
MAPTPISELRFVTRVRLPFETWRMPSPANRLDRPSNSLSTDEKHVGQFALARELVAELQNP